MADLGPFHNRPEEWELFQPLFGCSMLELGNKLNGRFTYKRFFERLGFRHVSVDWNGRDGALKLDLRYPLSLGTFDMVTNIGTSEHVADQGAVWRNICEALHIGSVLLCTTPVPGDWSWHGEHYPDDEFYKELCERNGLMMDRLYISGETPRRNWFMRARKVEFVPFAMPKTPIFKNR